MLHLAQAIIDRIIERVPDFSRVGGPALLAGFPAESIGSLLPACIVVPGGGTSIPQNSISRPDIEEQEWEIVVIVGYQYTDGTDGQTETIAGQLMKSVRAALHDWTFSNEAQRRPFKYVGRPAPAYAVGYAEFSLNFTVDANL